MWVKAKEKVQLDAVAADLAITQSVQQGSKWLAFHEEDISPYLPRRLNHKHLNIRMKKDCFSELFEEIYQD